MWFLKHVKKEDHLYCVIVRENHIVGRKGANILISNDPSVSRKHASLYVNYPVENMGDPEKVSFLFVKDEGSKYGTFRNGVRLESAGVTLVDGDIVKFGQFESEFRVSYSPLIIASSCLENSAKKELQRNIHALGGHITSEWRPSCTHLVMSEIKVTIKALCCLVSAKPIVVPTYFLELIKSLKAGNSTLVDCSKYIPPIGETLIEKVSFNIDVKRQSIFCDKTFIFLDEKQYKKLHLGIFMGGGKAVILTDDKVDANLILSDGVCVVQPQKEIASSQMKMTLVKQVLSLLERKGKRMIPESDFGLAVAYCSTERYCNPDFSAASALLGTQKLPSQTFSQQEVYVPETEDDLANPGQSRVSKPSFIDETSFPQRNKPVSITKQCIEESQENLTTNKRKFLEDTQISFQTNEFRQESKRPRSEISSRLDFTSDLESDKSMVVSNDRYISQPIKQELDDIFNIDTDPESESPPPNKLPAERQPKIEIESPGNQSVTSRVELNVDSGIRAQNSLTNGFHTSVDKPSSDIDENLPRNLVKVHVVSLIKRRPVEIAQTRTPAEGPVKNFKKFRKVLPVGARVLPKIIGVHELIAYDKHGAKFVDDIGVDEIDNPEPLMLNEDKGEFDWDSQVK